MRISSADLHPDSSSAHSGSTSRMALWAIFPYDHLNATEMTMD